MGLFKHDLGSIELFWRLVADYLALKRTGPSNVNQPGLAIAHSQIT